MTATANRRVFLSTVAAGAIVAPFTQIDDEPHPERWPSTFPALRQRINGQPLAYLDSGATTLKPRSVIDAIATVGATT